MESDHLLHSYDRNEVPICQKFFGWVRMGSDHGPRSYQERALPLSHAPPNILTDGILTRWTFLFQSLISLIYYEVGGTMAAFAFADIALKKINSIFQFQGGTNEKNTRMA